MFKRHFLNGKVTVLLILSLFMIGCASPKANDVKSDFSNLQSLKVSIFPSSRNTKTYLFRFSSDNALEVLFGERNNDDIESKNYLEVSKSKKKMLKKDQLEKLSRLAAEIEKKEINTLDFVMCDGWEVIVLIDQTKYHFMYGKYDDESIEELIKELIDYSPIKVDIHSWP